MSDPDPTILKPVRVRRSRARQTRWSLFRSAKAYLPYIYGIIYFGFYYLSFLSGYVPSRAWLQISEPYVTIFVAALSLVGTAFVYPGARTGGSRSRRYKLRWVHVSAVLFAVMIYFMTVDVFRRAFPSLIAIAWGDRVELPFVIDRADDGGSRYCHRPIVLRDMPVRTKLCEMPQEFLDQLHPGMPAIFIGTGTWMGLFVEDFRIP